MLFSVLAFDWLLTAAGLNHLVEILQSYVFFYLLLASSFIFLLGLSGDLKRFFFFSELAWLALFGVMLSLSSRLNLNPTHAHAFFILVFTACEAVTLACLLLLTFETRKRKTSIQV